MNGYNFNQLHPEFRGRYQKFLQDLTGAGLAVRPGSGFRSIEEQTQLYNNRAKNKYPVAPPGHSGHNYGLAGDFRPEREFTPEQWQEVRKHAVSNGLTWGGDFNDPIHVQFGPSNYGLLKDAPKGPDGFVVLPQDWVKGVPAPQPGPSYSGIPGAGENSPREVLGVGPGQGPAAAKTPAATGKNPGELASMAAGKLMEKAQEGLQAEQAADERNRQQVLAMHQQAASTKPMMDFQPIQMNNEMDEGGLLGSAMMGRPAIGTSGVVRRKPSMGLL